MCLVVYLASRSPLPLVPLRQDQPAFNVQELPADLERGRWHLSLPYVCHAGSHTWCACGFNEGRPYRALYDDPTEMVDALESSARLVRYVREHRVEQIYSCCIFDVDKPQKYERRIIPELLMAEDFQFIEGELLTIDLDAV